MSSYRNGRAVERAASKRELSPLRKRERALRALEREAMARPLDVARLEAELHAVPVEVAL
jgi:hypothetical protein